MRRLSISLFRAAAAVAATVSMMAAAPASAQQMSWTGFYLGGHLGGAWGDLDGLDLNGFVGGIHGGYNLQNGNIVYGIEGDFSWTGADAKESDDGTPGSCNRRLRVCTPGVGASSDTIEQNWLASLRARLGFTFANMLIYGTGGIGWSNIDINATTAGIGSGSDSATHIGWVAGGGLEMKLLPNLSGRAEVLHYGLGSETYNILGTATNLDLDTTVVRAGLSYHFN